MTHNKFTFSSLGLKDVLIKSLNEIKYITPSPIQKLCIPFLLKGVDVLGMAQTGSGKTAAFALPLLNNINLNLQMPQILVLTPTRELAIQVSKSFSIFAKYIRGINILALYGGQRYELQLKVLKLGPQIVVGTPGRLLDHLKRKTLNLSKLKSLVLDEADEMLRMGFIEDVKNIMSNVPKEHQTALFSATMPNVIRKISRRFMKFPKEIKIESNLRNRPNIKQKFWMVYGKKTDALIKFLETEKFSATIIFVKTKNATLEVSEALEKHGYNSSALNGDMNQSVREKTLEKLKDGRLDILIATDVAARGLDVDRISLVINYDIPMDVESYIHRIGRTGRAGRSGNALLFVEPRERRLLYNIEKIIKTKIVKIDLPKTELLVKNRLKNFCKKIKEELKSKDLDVYKKILKKIDIGKKVSLEVLSSVFLKMAQKDRPLIVQDNFEKKNREINNNFKENFTYNNKLYKNNKKKFLDMNSYRINVGKKDRAEVRHIVGAIANEGNINSKDIGHIKLFDFYSIVEISKKVANSINLVNTFKNTRILNKLINIRFISGVNNRFNSNRIKKKIKRNNFNYKFNNRRKNN
ncbi:DEAD/DEAH box helicase [Buchnera aphidicola (Ceratoglyphina bambusae)]|uniref:DEAD/DEAH box helicase n=1 Tax=Buchnera aphidicola TaxID=9 RepID=UPI0031B80C69